MCQILRRDFRNELFHIIYDSFDNLFDDKEWKKLNPGFDADKFIDDPEILSKTEEGLIKDKIKDAKKLE